MRHAVPLAALLLAAAVPALAAPQIGAFGVDTAGMNPGIKPGDDFVAFAGGRFLDALTIPADKGSDGAFVQLRDLSDARSRAILEDAATGRLTGANARRIGDFYASFMDEAGIEAKGIAPLQPVLAQIAAVDTPATLAAALGGSARRGAGSPIQLSVIADAKDPDAVVGSVFQGGLGLPDREYYLDTQNPKFAEARAAYRRWATEALGLIGENDAAPRADAVLALETKIAAAHWTRVESRQADKRYNPFAREALAQRFPGIDWAALLAAGGLDREARLIVAQPSAIEGVGRLLNEVPLPVWRDYLRLRAVKAATPMLPRAFVDADFRLTSALSGTPEQRPRWKRAVAATTDAMGEAVGAIYVARHFPPQAKAKADALVKNVIAAMDARLATLEWMDPKTRVAAREKLAAFTPKIGYPDTWRDYGALKVVRGDALGNAMRAEAFEYDRNLAKLGRRVDRGEWRMTPMTVNAYANFTWNEIVFPAAILQPPFFDPAADPAVNYGAIGAVIGHEISHHFDDQGRKYDKTGRLADWWTPGDVQRFEALTGRVVAQYGAYEPLPGRKVNGALTLGENIGDLAGLTVAYDAWQRSLGGRPAPAIDGFTGDQRFFLGFAQVWRNKYRDGVLLQQLTTDPHTPGHFRPYVVRNLDAWYSAFEVKPGEKLYLSPEARARVW